MKASPVAGRRERAAAPCGAKAGVLQRDSEEVPDVERVLPRASLHVQLRRESLHHMAKDPRPPSRAAVWRDSHALMRDCARQHMQCLPTATLDVNNVGECRRRRLTKLPQLTSQPTTAVEADARNCRVSEGMETLMCGVGVTTGQAPWVRKSLQTKPEGGVKG